MLLVILQILEKPLVILRPMFLIQFFRGNRQANDSIIAHASLDASAYSLGKHTYHFLLLHQVVWILGRLSIAINFFAGY